MSNIASNLIEVFPSTKRTAEYQKSARQLSEKNLVSIINKLIDTDAFVITSPGTVTNLTMGIEFNMHGYYFKVSNIQAVIESTNNPNSIYANIIIESDEDGYTELSGQDTGGTSSIYNGISFTADLPDNTALKATQQRFSLLLLKKEGSNWEIPIESTVKFLGSRIFGAVTKVDGGEV